MVFSNFGLCGFGGSVFSCFAVPPRSVVARRTGDLVELVPKGVLPVTLSVTCGAASGGDSIVVDALSRFVALLPPAFVLFW